MRIIGGKLKGHTINIPTDKNTSPLKDIARESIFNLLIHSKKISLRLEKSIILDIYAGTGSFGLEYLSRDAQNVYFIENRKSAVEVLKKNIEKLKLKNKINIFSSDIFDLLEKKNTFKSRFDLIFCDPPFKDTNIEKLIKLIFDQNLLIKGGILIIHRKKTTKEKLPDCFRIIDERIYGISKIIFGKFLY